MSTSNIKVRDIDAYSKGFNKGFEAAEVNRKLTSVQASIIKAVFYQEYADSFYQGVADGWQHSFDKKKRILKEQVVAKAEDKEPQQPVLSERSQQHNARVQEKRQLSAQEKAARLAKRQAELQQQNAQQNRDTPELER